eukprot:CAMPEP_0177265964 /NCGR_PEP_ID=MMETSP0367-20130122/62411_1 /TAXON_ID=447022 ORGANISM="Scrippsiella hangoei-like, Strain SHHI-4" /NCGR_SAMPLE_ID=MMETSP0367 /ASSEMBLY_ACC=CAM_ASM_000362 /LENGTH=96 /DNA_ID=CAMNT_0018721261 /DNA_START=422 /DNA_END=712 /DNA_ORIENTATION=-
MHVRLDQVKFRAALAANAIRIAIVPAPTVDFRRWHGEQEQGDVASARRARVAKINGYADGIANGWYPGVVGVSGGCVTERVEEVVPSIWLGRDHDA